MKGNHIYKQTSKILIILTMMFAFLCSPITKLFTKVSKVFAADKSQLTNVEGKKVQVVGFDSTAVLGDAVRLPKVIVDGTNYDAKTNDETNLIYDIKCTTSKDKVSKDDITLGNDGYYYFTPATEGVYTLDIHTVNENQLVTYAKGLQITVSKSTASFTVTNSAVMNGSNTAYVLPEKISLATLASADFKMPAAVVDENAVDGDMVLKLIPAGSAETNAITLQLNHVQDGTDYYTISESDRTALTTANKLGQYTFKYSYLKNDVKIASDVTLKTEVVADNTFADDIELKISTLTSSVELSAGEIGNWITLPTATVYDKSTGTTDSLPVALNINVTANSDVQGNVNIEYDGYNFKANKLGTYTVTYTATYPYTNKTVEKVFNITLKDTTSPTVKFVEAYDRNAYFQTNTDATEEEFLDSLTDYADSIKSVYVMSGDEMSIVLPAIYAEDNSTDGNFTFTREVVKPNNEVTTISTAANQTHSFTATAEGVYTLNYKATDPNGKTTTAKYQFVVVKPATLISLDAKAEGDIAKLSKPIITTGTVNRTVDDNGVITFAVPTASDALSDAFKDEFSALKKYSSNWKSDIKITTTIQAYTSADAEITGASYTFTNDDINTKTNKYELDLSEHPELVTGAVSYYLIHYSATTDWMTETAVQLAAKTAQSSKIEYINAASDITAAEINFASYGDYKIIATETYSDLIYAHNDEHINAVVQSYNDKKQAGDQLYNTVIGLNGMITDGTTPIAPFNQYSSENNQMVKLPNLIITDAEDGTSMSVTGTLTDAQGNSSSFVPQVTGMEVVAGKYTYYVTLGEHKLTSAGLYTITITAKDKGGNISLYSFGLNVNDTTSPSDITLDADIIGERTINKTFYTGEFIYYPEADIKDNGSDAQECTYVVELTSSPAGAKVVENQYNRGFKTLTAGTYEITYTCKDKAGNELVKVYALEVTAKNHTTISVAEFQKDYVWDVTTTTKEIKLPYGVAINNVDPSINGEKIKPVVKTKSGTTQTVKEDGDNYKFNATQGVYTVTYKYDSATTVEYTLNIGDVDAPKLTWKEEVPTSLNLNDAWGADLESKFTLSDFKNGLKNDENVEILSIKLKTPSNTTISNFGTDNYTFKEEGNYTLTIEYTDGVTTNTVTKTITVASEEVEPENNINNVVGTILLIASIVIVGGVVVYLTITSRNKSSKK
ncbi:MAG: hypothetical protein IJA61_00815 [Clostridia bacterium]|nr:hypothetical protein [Clostridia bacterium]